MYVAILCSLDCVKVLMDSVDYPLVTVSSRPASICHLGHMSSGMMHLESIKTLIADSASSSCTQCKLDG